MFASTGLFKTIPCPKGVECDLLNCIFSHEASGIAQQALYFQQTNKGSDLDHNVTQEPPSKRRRLTTTPPPVASHNIVPSSQHIKLGASTVSSGNPKQESTSKVVRSSPNLGSAPSSRPISPPPIRSAKHETTKQAGLTDKHYCSQIKQQLTPVKKESLLPRMLETAPASHGIRMAILKQLHGAMTTLNNQAAEDSATAKTFILSSDELITMALDEEESTAKRHPTVYTNIIKTFIMKLKKMSLADWRNLVAETFKKKFMPTEPTPLKRKEKLITSELTPEQEVEVLRRMRTPLAGLERFGYVTSPPTEAEVAAAREGVEMAGGFEKCERCSTRFQVFPGRRAEDGALTSGGSCTYHWAKLFRPPKRRTDTMTGQQEPYFPCCNETVGQSIGCTVAPHHVFKITEPKRLASVWQFESTPPAGSDRRTPTIHPPLQNKPGAVAFDAEMGYTTQGLEIIRLTAVSWPGGEQLLDVLVRPIGEILDLNTRFSGVTLSHIVDAIPYGQQKRGDNTVSSMKAHASHVSEDGELLEDSEATTKPSNTPIRIVPNPQAARSLLFSLIDRDTPLIGHAIDNDLNVTRIIHPFIVDTVLLYPHPKGLPIRYGLKMLASKYLERDIQKIGGGLGQGDIKGHDSREDAIATGDLVRVKVGERWIRMKKDGWTWKDGRLIDPPQTPSDSTPSASTNSKRKHENEGGHDESGKDTLDLQPE